MPKKINHPHPLRLTREAISDHYKLSQEALASLVGCSKNSIQLIESGKIKLSLDMALRIDACLGSNLGKWVESGSDLNQFSLNKDKILRNFRLLHDPAYSDAQQQARAANGNTAPVKESAEGIFKALYDAALAQGRLLELKFELMDWAEKQNKKLGLVLPPYWFNEGNDFRPSASLVAYFMTDSELKKLGIKKLTKPADHPDAPVKNITIGFQGLDAN